MSALARLQSQFDDRPALAGDPARVSAFERFRDAGLPTTKAEDWRWADISAIEAALAAKPEGGAPAAVDEWFIEGLEGPRLVFVDGCYAPQLSAPGTVKLGAARVGGAPHVFGDLAHAIATGGYTLSIAATHASQGAIQLVHVATGGAAHLSHRIELGEDAQASVVETYVSAGGRPSWTNVALTVELARSARLMRRTRHAVHGGLATEVVRVAVGQAASYASMAIGSGGTARLEHHVELAGLGAYASIDGVLLGRERQTLDVLNKVLHAAPSTTSRQTWRSVADDRSTCAVTASVEVAHGAMKADAEQSLKALLMKRTATANAKPELAIYADDVRCAHGATVGELDRQALFYLTSRGIEPSAARAILTEAFLADALSDVAEEPVHDALLADVRRWLGEAK